MGAKRRVRGRPVNGILLLDKVSGIGSNDALQVAKRLFDARKAGHTGSLDLPASGLLPVCFGEATKISGFLLDATKRYHAVFKLGECTTTGDAAGEIVEQTAVADLQRGQVLAALKRFTGPIEQVPPMYSALKRNGTPLYKLAYQGVTVEREARPVTIYELTLNTIRGAELDVEVLCSKGTYIRTLAEDVGRALGYGGHVARLRRLGVGPFDVRDALTLDALETLAVEGQPALDAQLLSADAALASQPDVSLTEDASYYLCRGQAVLVPKAPSRGLVRLYDHSRQFLGVGQVLDDGRIAPRRLLKT